MSRCDINFEHSVAICLVFITLSLLLKVVPIMFFLGAKKCLSKGIH